MALKKFSSSEAINFGWNTFKNNVGFFILLMIFLTVVNAFLTAVGILLELIKRGTLQERFAISLDAFSFISDYDIIISLIFNIIAAIIGILIKMGCIKISLNFCDFGKVHFGGVFSCLLSFFKYVIALIIFSIALWGWMFLMVFPLVIAKIIWGIDWLTFILLLLIVLAIAIIPLSILWVRFRFFAYLIVDKRIGAIASLDRSYEITKGATWDLIIFYTLIIIINLIGLLPLGFGLLITIPITMLATAYIYRKLESPPEVTQMLVEPQIMNIPEVQEEPRIREVPEVKEEEPKTTAIESPPAADPAKNETE